MGEKMVPKRPQCKNIRLPGFDYSLPGAYFITICTKNREFLLDPAPVRATIQKWWVELPMKFDNAGIDEFIIMPNHFHGIIVLKDPTPEPQFPQ
jgi:REP element-mobilizing transposase RayT